MNFFLAARFRCSACFTETLEDRVLSDTITEINWVERGESRCSVQKQQGSELNLGDLLRPASALYSSWIQTQTQLNASALMLCSSRFQYSYGWNTKSHESLRYSWENTLGSHRMSSSYQLVPGLKTRKNDISASVLERRELSYLQILASKLLWPSELIESGPAELESSTVWEFPDLWTSERAQELIIRRVRAGKSANHVSSLSGLGLMNSEGQGRDRTWGAQDTWYCPVVHNQVEPTSKMSRYLLLHLFIYLFTNSTEHLGSCCYCKMIDDGMVWGRSVAVSIVFL